MSAVQQPAAEPGVGTVLGRYELLEELGRGAYGVVFRARDRVAADTVAIKLLKLERRTAVQVERMRRELRATRKITHTGVLRIHDLVEAGEHLLLSMEMIRGDTLRDRIERGPLGAAAWSKLARELASALEAAHKAGVTHRDLKPANILLRKPDDDAVIADFGISQLLEDPHVDVVEADTAAGLTLTREGQVVGTPLFMSPEQLAGEPVGPPADIFALGVVLHLAATGQPPHTAANVAGLRKARQQPPVPLASLAPGLPAASCALVDRMLAFAADARPTAAEIVAALEVRVEPPRRSRTAILFAAAGMALAAIAVTAYVVTRPTASEARTARFTIRAVNAGAPEDARLEPAVAALARHRLRAERRISLADDDADTGDAITVRFRRVGDGVTLDVVASAGGVEHTLASRRAASVVAALDDLAPELVALVGAATAPGPSAGEVAAMTAIGARSFDAYLHYQAAADLYFGGTDFDQEGMARELDAAIAADPGWVHPFLLMACGHGLAPDQAEPPLRRAHAEGDPDRDPVGWEMVAAFEEFLRGDRAGAAKQLAALDDLLAVDITAESLFFNEDLEGGLAELREAHARMPDAAFGTTMIMFLQQVGRAAEIPPLVEEWNERAPGLEAAMVASANLAATDGRWDEAERTIHDVELLHGAAPHRLVQRCDILIGAERVAEAQILVDELRRSDEVGQARGLYRSGVLAILDGRLGAAYQTLAEAVDANRPLGFEGETIQVLESLQSLAWVGGTGDLEKWTAMLAEVYDGFHLPRQAAMARFELAMLRRPKDGACPDVEAALAEVPAGRAATAARRDLQRLAAEGGCATCADVVRAGLSPREGSARSLARFAGCAEAEGADDLAAHAWTDLQRRRASLNIGAAIDGAYESVLAAYHLGAYEEFLAHWDHVDRPVPEVERARLKKGPPRSRPTR